jgi:DNA-binding NarL/FixJ family response regulator
VSVACLPKPADATGSVRGDPSAHAFIDGDDGFYGLPLHVLTDRQRVIVQLHYSDGWTLTRIARTFAISKQCVSRQHAAALRKMYRVLAADRRVNRVTNSTSLIEGA